MLLGLSFASAFVFSISSLILSGFLFISFQAYYLLFHGFILLRVQLSKNITKVFYL